MTDDEEEDVRYPEVFAVDALVMLLLDDRRLLLQEEFEDSEDDE